MADKLKRVTKANVGPRDNVGGAINNALVTVQDHNKVIDAVNLLINDDNTSGYVIVEVKAATAASNTTDFASVLIGDIILILSDDTSEANKFGVAVADATSPVTPVINHYIVVLRAA